MASHLVSQHQLSSYASPTNGQAGDATVVLGNDNTTVTGYNGHDSDGTIHVQDSSAAVFAVTPAGTQGRKWMTNDSGAVYLYFDNGSSWVEVNYLRTASTGVVTVTSTTTPQFIVRYDASNRFETSVSSAGAVTFNAVGASAGFTFSDAVTLSAALTYGGVALNNAVTGTGNMVLSASPTFTGTALAASLTLSGTLALAGATVSGTPTWSSSQAITLSTAAQPNVTSVGTLTSLTVSGAAVIGGAASFASTIASLTDVNAAYVAFDTDTAIFGAKASGANNRKVAIKTLNGGAALTAVEFAATTGAATFANTLTVTTGGLTVSAGTTAVQALTATSAIIGTTTDYGRLGQLVTVNKSATYGGLALTTWTTTAAEAPILDLNRSKSASLGTYTAVTTNDSLGFVTFRGANGSAFADGAYFKGVVTGAVASSLVPAKIEVYTTTTAGATELAATFNSDKSLAVVGGISATTGTFAQSGIGTIAGYNSGTGKAVVYGWNAGGPSYVDLVLNDTITVQGGGGGVLTSFDGPISIKNTVNVVSPTSPNRTVTMVINGTTYYLAAKTTND